MTIDFHTHVLPDEFRTRRERIAAADATFAALFGDSNARTAPVEALVAEMDDAGVDAAVVLGYGWTDPGVARLANDYALDAAGRCPSRIIPFCSVNPAWGESAVREVERCAARGARGVGELHPDTQGFDLADEAVTAPLMRCAEALGLIVLTHASEPVGHEYPGKGAVTPARLARFALRFPRCRMVFAHWGGGLPFYTLMPEVRRALRNVWFDSAASPFLYRAAVFSVASALPVSDRVLFGSDYPLLPIRRVLNQLEQSGIPARLRSAFAAGNAEALLGDGWQKGGSALEQRDARS